MKIVDQIKMIYLLLPTLSHIIVANLADMIYLNVVFHEEMVENEEAEDDSHGDCYEAQLERVDRALDSLLSQLLPVVDVLPLLHSLVHHQAGRHK